MERKIVKLSGGRIAQRTNIIGTRLWVYKVWEHSSVLDGGHSTITSFGRDWYGRIGTRRITQEINAIAVGPVRFKACDEWRREQARQAEALIHEAFAETRGHKANTYGEIEITQ